MRRRILESIEGAMNVIDRCRMEPVMDKVGDCAVYRYEDALQRIAKSYGIEPKGAAFEMLISPFRGYREILEIEFCDLHNPQEAKGILRQLDEEFKKRGLDLMEDRYPINSVPGGKIHDNGPVTHVAFVPVLKSPEESGNVPTEVGVPGREVDPEHEDGLHDEIPEPEDDSDEFENGREPEDAVPPEETRKPEPPAVRAVSSGKSNAVRRFITHSRKKRAPASFIDGQVDETDKALD